MSDSGEKLTSEVRQPIDTAIEAVKKALEGTDVEVINNAVEQLTAAQHKAAEQLYQQAGPEAPGPDISNDESTGSTEGGATSSGDADEIDAEVVEDEKK